jgi:hypothetical protein
MKDASLPITLIIVGLVWLAWHFRFFPDVDWLIAIASWSPGRCARIRRNQQDSIVTGRC